MHEETWKCNNDLLYLLLNIVFSLYKKYFYNRYQLIILIIIYNVIYIEKLHTRFNSVIF